MSTTQETGLDGAEEQASPEDGRADEGSDISVEQQMQFAADGEIEPSEENPESTLDQFEVGVPKRDPESQIDTPEADGLMNDNRPDRDSGGDSEQSNLFVDVDEGQQTLTGDSAQNQCPFEEEQA
jgi:hypothetical protein